MKVAKFEQLVQGQTGIAKKVYECVPIMDSWSTSEIANYMKTKTGSMADIRIVQGCLNTLVESGLIRNEGRNHYKRIPVEDKPKEVLKMKIVQPVKIEEKPTNTAAIDLLGSIASEVSAMAVEINAKLKRIAKSIEDAALTVESERENSHESVEKLRQLQSLLKSL